MLDILEGVSSLPLGLSVVVVVTASSHVFIVRSSSRAFAVRHCKVFESSSMRERECVIIER